MGPLAGSVNGPTNDFVSAVTNRVFVPQTPETFAYDADGNLTEDGRFRYWWNGENRMVRAEEKMPPEGRSAHVVVYAYDHQGRNVVKDGSLQIWDAYNIVVENAAASNSTINAWGLDIDGTMQGAGGVGGLLVVVRSGSISLLLYDANGNITEHVDSQGGVVAHTDYSAFGRGLMRNGVQNHSHGFSTKLWCRKSGLVEYQMRKHMPWQGRWIRRDGLEENGGVNLYIYAYNSQINYIDMLGNKCPCGEELTAILTVGPFDALTAKILSDEALELSKNLSEELGGGAWNGPTDAFRHCYWSCRMAQEIGKEQAKQIGDIHEDCAEKQPPGEEAMDRHNNAKGVELGDDKNDCKSGCIGLLERGELRKKPVVHIPKGIRLPFL